MKKEMTKRFTIQNADNLFAKDGQASSPMSDDSTLRSVSSELTSSKEASPSWFSAYADQKEKQKKKTVYFLIFLKHQFEYLIRQFQDSYL